MSEGPESQSDPRLPQPPREWIDETETAGTALMDAEQLKISRDSMAPIVLATSDRNSTNSTLPTILTEPSEEPETMPRKDRPEDLPTVVPTEPPPPPPTKATATAEPPKAVYKRRPRLWAIPLAMVITGLLLWQIWPYVAPRIGR